MSTTQTSLSDTYQEQQDSGSDSYLTTPKGRTSWLLTRDHKRIGLMFLVLFPIGGFTGIAVAALSLDVHLHDTCFVVSHFHYVMVGGMFMAFLGGLHFWWPKMMGRMYNEALAKIAAALIFIGFNVTFFPQFVLGSQGMPRRYYDYPEQYEWLHALSTYGSWVLGAGLLIVLIYLVDSLVRGRSAPANPWLGATLDWRATSMPPAPHNFARTPLVTTEPYDFSFIQVLFSDETAGKGHDDSMPADHQTRSQANT